MPLGDTNYNSTYALTALSSRGDGITDTGLYQKDLYNQLAEIETNFNGTLSKLDTDTGDTSWETSYTVDLNDNASEHGLSQDDIVSFLDSFTTNYNALLTAMDSDDGIGSSDYNSNYAVTDYVNNSKAITEAVDDNGMLQDALVNLLSHIKTKFDGALTYMDSDS